MKIRPEQKLGRNSVRPSVWRGPLVWSAAICGLAMGLSAAPVAAQPRTDGAEMSAEAAQIKREWGELQRAVGTEEVTAPAGAITRYQAFFEARGYGSGAVSVEIASRIAQLHWRGLGDRAKASEVLQWAIKQYAGLPQVERLQRELALVNGEGNATETPDLPDGPQATKLAPVAAPAVPSVALPLAPTVALPKAPSLKLPGAPIATLGGAMPGKVPAPQIVGGAMPGKVPVPQVAGGAPQPVKNVGGVGAVALTSLARRLSAGDLSQSEVEAAWQASGVSAAEVLDWLQTSARFDRDVQGALVPLMGLVAQHAPQLVSAPQEWNEREQLLLAKFYTTQKDERAEPIYLRLLEQIKAEPLQKREVPAVYGLHSYYLALGQTERAADMLLSASQYSTKLSVVGNTPVEAARLYREVGQDEKAKAAYAQAQESEFGWSVGLALHDQASVLMEQGRHEEARELLKQPVKGQFADQIQIANLSLLSRSYYKTGELEAASRYAKQCIEKAASMTLLQNDGLEGTINMAEAIQNWSAQWNKNPILVTAENFRKVLAPEETGEAMVRREFSVRTLRDVPLMATVDDKRIQVRVTDNKGENDYYVQKEVVVEVPYSLNQSVNATLTVSSPLFPAYQSRVPLRIEAPKKIQLSSSSVFFGEVKANQPMTRRLTLSAEVPFSVVGVKTDTPKLEVQSPAMRAAKEQTVTLSFSSPQVGRFYNGTIRVQTDVPGEEVIEVPYIARIR